ncbi:hypothetical protein M422DRAFT_226012 [Sphaerobolus stellatus SS14]|nr:hypothetical protein M422DRAFT_226012 [Sphaerobolus stellatus SS14]
MIQEGSSQTRRSLTARCAEVIRFYGPFGFIAFGGPAANIVMLRKTFVVREKWIDDKTFTDLFALGSALPGPSFSQLAFSIALLRGGFIPALLSFILLTGPGAVAMLGFGFGVRRIPLTLPDIVFALFSGLNSAAVGLIIVAAYDLSRKVITEPVTRIAVLLSAAFSTCYQSQWLYPVLMVVGGLGTFGWDSFVRWKEERKLNSKDTTGTMEVSPPAALSSPSSNRSPTPTPAADPQDVEMQTLPGSSAKNNLKDDLPVLQNDSSGLYQRKSADTKDIATAQVSELEPAEAEPEPSQYFKLSVIKGLVISISFIAFLVLAVILRATVLHQRAFSFFVNLLIAGTIIFGGGPVVIPLLRGYTVDPGWVNPRDFILGFAVIQALPGPLFNFSVFLGVLAFPHQPVLGALLGCVAIFLPGLTIKVGLLPIYTKWRSYRATKSVLRGLNAVAVGLIFSAIYRLIRVGFISPSGDPAVPAVYASLDADGWWVTITATTFVACEWFNVPAPVAIAGGAVGGIAWWGVTKR